MHAVVYARYSSGNQREASIEDQVRICRDHIDKQGWTCTQVYSDRAISGATTLRPGYQALLEDAQACNFDTVVVEALDRLSRDQADVASLYKQLSFLDIQIVTLAEGEITELHVGLKGTMNALYLKDLAQKTRRGLEGRVRQGRSGGGLCYGYDIVREVDAQGDPIRGGRRINEPEAGVVRRIFRDYAAGKSPRAIAINLNAEGIPGPHAGAWGQSTINGNRQRGIGILNNELFISRLVWNRQRFIKDPTTGKRQARPNSPEAWVVEEVPDLRIIDDDLWLAAKARQGDLKVPKQPKPGEPGFWDRRRPRYLLSGLVKCGLCGGGYSMISQTLMGCSTARNKGTCGNRLNIRRDALEATILAGLKSRLMQPDLVKVFAEAFIAEINKLRAVQAQQVKDLQNRLQQVERRIQKLVTAIAEGEPPQALLEELRRLETEQAELAHQVESAPKDPQPLLHPNISEIYRRKVADLHRLLDGSDTGDEAMAPIRALIDRIVVTPEDDELRVDLYGELATILQFASGKEKPAAEVRDGLAQLKLVAGAGFNSKLPTPTVLVVLVPPRVSAQA
jgi:DNA invertase Pin-like site-specific DNA recombinase